MGQHPLVLLRLVFLALVAAMVIAAYVTGARPRTPRQWNFVTLALTFLAWLLLGFGWVRG